MDQDENNKLTRRNFIRAIGGLALSASVIGLVPEALASAKDTDTTLRNKIKKSSIFNSFLDESDVAQFKFNLNDSYIMATPENKDIYAVFIPHSKQKKLEDRSCLIQLYVSYKDDTVLFGVANVFICSENVYSMNIEKCFDDTNNKNLLTQY